MAHAPNFVRFSRSLALLSGPLTSLGVVAIPTFVAGTLLCNCSSSVNGGGCAPDDADIAAGCHYCGCARVDSGHEASYDTSAADETDDTSPADAIDADSPDGVSLDSGDATTLDVADD